jgi:predicted component of type VI protein secretion system
MVPAQRENLPALLEDIQKQPLAALLTECYARYLNGETVPTLSPSMQQADGSAAAPVEAVAADVESATHPAPSTANSPGPGNSHQVPRIESRQQVLETLQDIETYYLHAEPASPVPLMIADIRKLVPKRFSDLVSDFSRLLPAAPDKS